VCRFTAEAGDDVREIVLFNNCLASGTVHSCRETEQQDVLICFFRSRSRRLVRRLGKQPVLSSD